MKITTLNKLLEKPPYDLLALGITAVFAIIGSIVSVLRYWQYEVFYFDFGIFDHAIWKVAHFKAPIIEHFIPDVAGKIIFADHFNPSIFLLSPLYWLTSRQEIVFVAQALIVAISGYVLYRIAREVLQSRFLSFTLLILYFLFIGLQNAVITEFHELTVMTLPLTLLWWAVVKRKVWLFFLMLVVTLGFKEALFSLGIGIAIAIFFMAKDWRKIAIITACISLVWGMVSIKFLIPYFSEGIYIYSPSLPPTILGKALAFVNEPEKRQTLFYSFLSFGFLPVFSPAFWAAIIQDYALRFMPEGFQTRWGLGLHYNAQSAVLLALSSIYGLRMLSKKAIKAYLPIGAFFLILVAVILNWRLHAPFHMVYNQAFYNHTHDFAFINEFVSKIPAEGSVMTQNVLAARFTHQDIWLLREDYEKYQPDYIVFDMRTGQNPNNFFGSTNPEGILGKVKADPKYKLVFSTEDQFIFEKK